MLFLKVDIVHRMRFFRLDDEIMALEGLALPRDLSPALIRGQVGENSGLDLKIMCRNRGWYEQT